MVAPLARLRKLCLALPEAEERETWERPTFRIQDKIFAMPRERDGRWSVWLKAPRGAQEVLLAADPVRFFVPLYVGPKGWVGVMLEPAPDCPEVDWAEVAALVARSYRLVAPKRLAVLVAE